MFIDSTGKVAIASVRKLLGVLENVEKVVVNSNAKEKAAKESAEKSAGKHGKGKSRGTNSNEVQVPKKARVENSCALCQKYGGAHTTHNTGECRKYNKDGTLQKSFSAKAAIEQKLHLCAGYGTLLETRESGQKEPQKLQKEEASPRK